MPSSAKTSHVSTTGDVVHHWAPELCGACPLRDQCTKADHRALAVTADYHARRKRERYANTKAGRAKLRLRMAAEHAIGRLKNMGAGTSRYFGRAKTRVQWLWCAAVVNLTRVWALTTEPERHLRAA